MTAQAVEEWLVSKIAEALKVDQQRVDRTLSFTSQGLDSLAILTLTGDLAEFVGRDLSTSLLWEYPAVAELATHLASFAEDTADESIPSVARDQPVPLTFAQERIWLHSTRDAKGDSNLVVQRFALEGNLDAGALRRSVAELVQRHEILRTTFRVADDQPVQVIHPASEACFRLVDLTGEPDPAAEALRLLRDDAEQPMHLERGPLFRVMLLRLGASEHRLVFVLHHILYDAASIRTFYSEFGELYAAFSGGVPPALPEVRLQMADFAAWQRNRLRKDGEIYQRKLAWWKSYWSGPMPPAIKFPFRRVGKPEIPDVEKGLVDWIFPLELAGQIGALAHREGATTYMLLLAAFQAVLHQISGQQEFIVGTYVSDRSRHVSRDSIGFFVNLRALRVRLVGQPTFLEYLREVRSTLHDVVVNQELPLEDLSRELQAEGRQVPVVQVIFQHVPSAGGAFKLQGLSVARWKAELPPKKNWGLTLSIYESSGQFQAQLLFDTELYEAGGAAALLRLYAALLERIVVDPHHRILPSAMASPAAPSAGEGGC